MAEATHDTTTDKDIDADSDSEIRDETPSGLSPRDVLIVFTGAQIMMYYDRGLLAGFLPAVLTDVGAAVEGGLNNSDAGLLGSGFILGYMCACPIFAYFAKYVSPYKLMCCGLMLWCAATWSCGFTHQYETFLFGRIITGIGEASFAGLAPTVIDDVAPAAHRTLWLSIFFAGLPVGGALGYIFGGIFAIWSWRVGFLTEAFLMIPLALVIFFIPNTGATKTGMESDDEINSPIISPHHSHHSFMTQPSYLDLRLLDTTLTSNNKLIRPRSHPSLSQYQHPHPHPRMPQSTRATSTTQKRISQPVPSRSDVVEIPVNHIASSRGPSPSASPNPSWSKYASSPSLVTLDYTSYDKNKNQSHDDIHPTQPVSITVSPMTPRTPRPPDSFGNDIWSLLSDPVYMFVVFGYAGLAFVIGALSFWAPVDFALTLRITLQQSTAAIGSITFLCGILGTAFGGWLLDYRGGGKGIHGVLASLQLSSVFTVLAIMFSLVAVYSKNMFISLPSLAIADFFLFGTAAPINAALLSVSPQHLRSLGMAMSILLMHLLGDLPSPYLMGYITDNMGDVQLALFGLCTWLLWTVLCWGIAAWLARKRVLQLKYQLEVAAASENSPLMKGIQSSYGTQHDELESPNHTSAPHIHIPDQSQDVTTSTTTAVTGV